MGHQGLHFAPAILIFIDILLGQGDGARRINFPIPTDFPSIDHLSETL